MSKKPLSNVDTAWLRMEVPTNLMMISGVMVFGAPLDYARLKATLEGRLLRFDRFRQRVVQSLCPGSGFYWQDDPDFDLDYHLQRASLPPPGDLASLQDLTSLLASTQLDLSRPLWQLHLVQGYGDGSALICRLHHCIGDGLALVHVLLSLTDAEPDAPWPVLQPEPSSLLRRQSSGTLTRPLRSVGAKSRWAASAMLSQGRKIRANPVRAFDLVRLGAGGATALGRLVLRWPDPKTVLKGELGVAKRAAWSAPIPLEDVKAVGKGLEGTVNDVLLAAMTGGLRRYLQGRGEQADGLDFRAIVPVNLRRPGTEEELGNKFGLVFLTLPVGVEDPVDRLHELKRRMDGLKGSLEPPVAYGILNLLGMSPAAVQDVAVDIFETKGTAVMTNVIGPKEQIYLAGVPLDSLMFWVPQSGHLGIGVSILSYAGEVWLGVITDEGLVPDPEKIVAWFEVEFRELLARAQGREEMGDSRKMSARLDGALSTLDAILEEKATTEDSRMAQETKHDKPPMEPSSHCQAMTKAGRSCKNYALPGSRLCRVHES
jgi:diacylglycerol O-acyltransferase